MLDTQFSLSWEQHMHNIGFGLSKFQKSGEFVDLTLAADGYFVKAHQMILSLVSPYIKDIITSLKCSHPVIFLNNMSYKTLCSILDYVYKGEVQVSKEQLDDLIQAGKVLQIKGLQEMSPHIVASNSTANQTTLNSSNIQNENEKTDMSLLKEEPREHLLIDIEDSNKEYNQDILMEVDKNTKIEVILDENNDEEFQTADLSDTNETSLNEKHETNEFPTPFFTISNQGSLQLVLNGFLYFLKYNSASASGHSQWKCVNYINTKCQAYVITKNDRIIQKDGTHSHPTHDTKIAKKVSSGELFSTMKSANEIAQTKKKINCKRNKARKIITSI